MRPVSVGCQALAAYEEAARLGSSNAEVEAKVKALQRQLQKQASSSSRKSSKVKVRDYAVTSAETFRADYHSTETRI